MSDPREVLRTTFGFPDFRGVQADVVSRVLAGRRTLAIMPTGAGKSLTYQLPAVMLEGTCLVVSPLIALMHDQLRAAEAVGIRAATLTSADDNRDETIRRFRDGRLDLLYVAPERASNESFRNLLRQAPLSMFAIDEAHCVSEWGHDFRPDYRLLRPLLDSFPGLPRLALTATADDHTRADILDQLGIPHDGLIVAGFDRPNIRYAITNTASKGSAIASLVKRTPGAGIVYATSRDRTEKLAATLAGTGRPTRYYHAGMAPDERRRAQAEFVRSEDMVMVATIVGFSFFGVILGVLLKSLFESAYAVVFSLYALLLPVFAYFLPVLDQFWLHWIPTWGTLYGVRAALFPTGRPDDVWLAIQSMLPAFALFVLVALALVQRRLLRRDR